MKPLALSPRTALFPLLILLIIAGTAALTHGQAAGPDFHWAIRDGAWVFTLHFDHPAQVQATDQHRDMGYFYLDCANEKGPDKPAEWPFKTPQITHVRRVYYPEQRVLRYVFYIPRGSNVHIENSMADPQTCQVSIESIEKTTAPPPPPPLARPAGGPIKKMVVIDPGHGGMPADAQVGARTSRSFGSTRYYEKDIVLAIGLYLEQYLKQSPNLDVFLTRHEDRYVSLEDRISLANQAHGDLFLSIHLNAIGPERNRNIRGIEFYYLTNEDRAANHQLAAMENEEKIHLNEKDSSGETLRQLLRALAGEKFPEVQAQSKDFCNALREDFLTAGPFVNHVRRVKAEAFRVLLNFNMPAALVECGFIDNNDDARMLIQASTQKQIAACLFNGINRYFASVDPTFTPHPMKVGP